MEAFQKIYDCLFFKYGPQGWWPLIDRKHTPLECYYVPENTSMVKTGEQAFEICIGAILTQNTSWSNAEKALVSLVSNNFLNPLALSGADTEELAGMITSSGYYNQKAKKLKAFAAFFLTNPAPDRGAFLEQWGLGPETVDDMLLYAFDRPVFVIDLYTIRLFSRLGLCPATVSYGSLQSLFTDNIKKDVNLYKEYHALIVRHAKEHCRKVPNCNGCVLKSCCSF